MKTYSTVVFVAMILFFDKFTARVILSPENIGTALECDKLESKICMNNGVCVDWARMFNVYGEHESCVCQYGFYGPHCEYADERVLFKRDSRVRRQQIYAF